MSAKIAKGTWLVFQGNYYEDEPAEIGSSEGRADDVAFKKSLVANSTE